MKFVTSTTTKKPPSPANGKPSASITAFPAQPTTPPATRVHFHDPKSSVGLIQKVPSG